jgi:hypothetical protein
MAVIPGERGAARGGAGYRAVATKTPPKTTTKKAAPVAPKPSVPKAAAPAAPQQIDWASLLGDDPSLVAAIQQAKTGNQLALEQQQLADQQAAIGYGAIPDLTAEYAQNPDLFVQKYGGTPDQLFPQTVRDAAGLATSNHLSTLAQIADQYALNQNTALDSLAGRGLSHSGGVLQAAEKDARTRDIASSQGLATLMGQLASNASAYQNTLSSNANAQTTAATTALQNIYNNINSGAISNPPTSSTTGSTSSTGTGPAAPNPKPVKLTAGPPLAKFGPPSNRFAVTPGGRLPL